MCVIQRQMPGGEAFCAPYLGCLFAVLLEMGQVGLVGQQRGSLLLAVLADAVQRLGVPERTANSWSKACKLHARNSSK